MIFLWERKISPCRFDKRIQVGNTDLPHRPTESCFCDVYITTVLTINNWPFCLQNFAHYLFVQPKANSEGNLFELIISAFWFSGTNGTEITHFSFKSRYKKNSFRELLLITANYMNTTSCHLTKRTCPFMWCSCSSKDLSTISVFAVLLKVSRLLK